MNRLKLLAALMASLSGSVVFAVGSQRPLSSSEVELASLLLKNQEAIQSKLTENKIVGPVTVINGVATEGSAPMFEAYGYAMVLTQCQLNLPMPCRPLGTLSIEVTSSTGENAGQAPTTTVEFTKSQSPN